MMLYHLTDCQWHVFADGCGDILAWVNHKERPADDKHEQGNGGLVDFGNSLNGYKEIANDEENDDGNA